MVGATGMSMGTASYIATHLFGISSNEIVLVAPAFVIALVLEVLFDLFVVVEIEATSPGGSRHLLDSLVVPAANVFLPAVCVAILTPYVVDDPWQFAVLLPILLVGMYGALWVANSQQREKRRGDRLKDTFSRYVPEGIVDDNIESIQEIELGGEQHEVSVLFCDIRGFTSWSEDKGATEVITELNVLLTELSASVMGTGGTLDKFTGDGLMAFWGAPVPVEDHADRASRAALDMLVRLDAVNDRRSEDGQAPFAIGVAVHSGTAVVGNVGHERRLDYTAIGDTVNTTARLEASTKDLGAVLLVSRATVDQLGDELRERAMRIGDVMMKGKARPVEAWALQPLRPELDGVDDEFAA
jgi:class 3 adenylate cyclase